MRPTVRCPEIGRGHQEGRVFHGCHDSACFLPLHVSGGDPLLVTGRHRPGEALCFKEPGSVEKRFSTACDA